MIKVSTSGKKKGTQKYQNFYAFRANKNSKKTKLINLLPINSVCKNIIEWRKKFKRYKLLKTPKRCVCYEEKTIKEAYHILCNKCAKDKGVCAKCQGSEDIVVTYLRQSKHGGVVLLSNQDQETEDDDDHLDSVSDEETNDEESS
ncbi:13714_t:CDS:2 [Gigaspora rosea]|nr:13714_t:CDS:2 [Gigaspora rosea]